jgi:V/A-type H+-transporting ATPase subunit K
MKVQKLAALLMMFLGVIIVTLTASMAFSQTTQEPAQDAELAKALWMVGAGIGAGLAMGGAGVGMGTASAAAIGAIAEKPEILGRTLLYVLLIEAIAIYGLVMFFIIYSQLIA